MIDAQAIIRLQTWLSPAFPTGAFSYSHGLEAAIDAGHIKDGQALREWLKDMIESGPGWNDNVLLAASWRSAPSLSELKDIAELCEAMAFSLERHLETMAQGTAFAMAAKPWMNGFKLPDPCALPVAVGAITRHAEIPVEEACAAYLHAYLSNQVQAALRLMKLGQQGGVAILAELEPHLLIIAERASRSSLEELGSNCITADITSMQHETLKSRIFLS